MSEDAECVWCATDPATRRFQQLAHRSDARSLRQRVESLREPGSGYVEVARSDRPFPWLSISLSGDDGVVHQFASPDRSLLLKGDGSRGRHLLLEAPVFDEMHTFTGEYVSGVGRVLDIVMRFVAGAELTELADWEAL